MIKRVVALVLAALLLLLTGCVKVRKNETDADERLYVVCTAFVQYDFIRNIAGDSVRLELLVPAGSDTHNFGLKDISISKLDRLSSADLVLYVGGESDALLISDLKKTLGENTEFVSLLSLVENPLCVEEHVHDAHTHEEEYDEHVWTSPKRAIELVTEIAALLCGMAPESADVVHAGQEKYIKELTALAQDYEKAMENRTYTDLIFADRFPFRYLCHDYDIQAFAAFEGCSTEVEPSLSVLNALYEKAAELGLPAILYMEGSDSSYAENLAKKIGGKALLLHSCHNLTSKELESESYLTLMRKNLAVLETALSIGK